MDTIEDSGHSPGPASSIKAIDQRSVHRICSGQVVLTLATAVKELVENSIDAGATSVEVRLKEYGVDFIEVIDNGVGVEADNFAGLTLKHHTSKLREFSDLTNVDTFGFRGEALSSLCALSTLSVTTCHKDASVGTKLEFNTNGHIVSQTPCARQTGTTVSLGQLFHTLPVRHKEFQRNIKKEFSKMVHVLNGYCLISTHTRITCTNQQGKGKKSVIVSTNGNDSIRENITNIFGPKQSLVKFVQVLPNEQVCNEYNIKVPEAKVFSVEGYVSSSEHGQGRGSSDRQFVFVNRRPCDLAKVSRVVNEVYHSYNRHQFPFVVLDISLAKDSVDVNVTPDKRQIFISEEKLLLGTIKTSLIQLFEPISSVFQTNQGQGKVAAALMSSLSQRRSLDSSQQGVLKKSASCPYSSPKTTLTSALASLKRSFSSAFNKTDETPDNKPATPNEKPDKQRRLDGFLHRDIKPPVLSSPRAGSLPDTPHETPPSTSDSVSSSPSVIFIETRSPNTTSETSGHSETSNSQTTLEGHLQPGADCSNNVNNENNDITSRNDVIRSLDDVTASRDDVTASMDNVDTIPSDVKRTNYPVTLDTPEAYRADRTLGDDRLDGDCLDITLESREDLDVEAPMVVQHKMTEYDQAGTRPHSRDSAVIPFSMSQLRARIRRKEKAEEAAKEMFRSFRAQIAPGDNQAAEDELKKEIKKEMFSKMEILGQFNLGFIITRLGSDLFIVDQHATDEKYNFEMLQQHTVIRSQKLIQPQKLELTASNSSILIDNIDVFKTNGFEFVIDEEAPITSRVRLTAMPVSKNWTFGKDDIEELIFMLTDSPGVLCRPSRVRMMFASRACRKSIMVGTALNKPEMRKVVNHMGEIEQPWNCPHGRPTMRHLINLDCLHDLGT